MCLSILLNTNMTFEESIAKFNLGELPITQLPKIALNAVMSGLESESLIILAGMNENDNSLEIQQYLDNVIKELGLKSYHSIDAAFILANSYINSFKKGEINISQCIYNIKNECWDNCRDQIDSIEYLYDGIQFHEIIGPWYEYDEIDEHTDWVKKSNKSISQIRKDFEKELSSLISIWQEEFLSTKLTKLYS